MSKSTTKVQYKENEHLRATQHSKFRFIDRCTEASSIDDIEEAQFYPVANPEDLNRCDDLIYCAEYEALGVKKGRNIVTILKRPSRKFVLEDDEYHYKNSNNNQDKSFEIDSRVIQEAKDRIFEHF